MKTLKEFCVENNLDLDKYEKWVLRQTYCSICKTPPAEIIKNGYQFTWNCEYQCYNFISCSDGTNEYVFADTQRLSLSELDLDENYRHYAIKYPDCLRIYKLAGNRLYFVKEI